MEHEDDCDTSRSLSSWNNSHRDRKETGEIDDETIKMLRSARILIIVRQNWGVLLSLRPQWKVPVTPGKKNSQRILRYKRITPARRPDLVIVKNKKEVRAYWIMDFAVLVDYRVKLKESEKRDRYLDLARELKKLWNMKVTVIPM